MVIIKKQCWLDNIMYYNYLCDIVLKKKLTFEDNILDNIAVMYIQVNTNKQNVE